MPSGNFPVSLCKSLLYDSLEALHFRNPLWGVISKNILTFFTPGSTTNFKIHDILCIAAFGYMNYILGIFPE